MPGKRSSAIEIRLIGGFSKLDHSHDSFFSIAASFLELRTNFPCHPSVNRESRGPHFTKYAGLGDDAGECNPKRETAIANLLIESSKSQRVISPRSSYLSEKPVTFKCGVQSLRGALLDMFFGGRPIDRFSTSSCA